MAAATITREEAAAAHASLETTLARESATLRLLRPLGLLLLTLAVAAAARTEPTPGLGGRNLGVLLALVVFAVAGIGAFTAPMSVTNANTLMPLFVALVASSSALAWLQPDGPGFLGAIVGVSVAAMRLSARRGGMVAALALFGIALAGAFASGHTVTGAIFNELGVVAFYTISRLAQRLREGQCEALALLEQLEESHAAQAEAVALAERQRLAREMHDVLAHSLSGVVLHLDGARLLARKSDADAEVEGAIDNALHLARGGLEEARRAIATLRGEELPGPERLPALVHEFEAQAGIACTLDVSGEERHLEPAARLTLYRVAQEALTNVRKHARPHAVELRLSYEPQGTRLLVEDFSDGAAVRESSNGGGYGITGMRERAELLGGRLDASPTPSGFRVELWVPA